MKWTTEQENTLHKFWNQGLTASDIMPLVNAPSRNSVLGKVSRMGLIKRVDPDQPRKVGYVKKTKPVELIPAGQPNPEWVTLDQATGCLWPSGTGPVYRFCNCPRYSGVYCAEHYPISLSTYRIKDVAEPAEKDHLDDLEALSDSVQAS